MALFQQLGVKAPVGSLKVSTGSAIDVVLWGVGNTGEKLTVTLNNPLIAAIEEMHNSVLPGMRVFRITGRLPGNAMLEASGADGRSVRASTPVVVSRKRVEEKSLLPHHGRHIGHASREDNGTIPFLVRETEWFRLVVDIWGTSPYIKVLERWAFHWTVEPGLPMWTEMEKRVFYAFSIAWIQYLFGNTKLRMRTTRSPGSWTFPLVFDVGWALEQYKHWTVHVVKNNGDLFNPRSHVFWEGKSIHLKSADMQEINSPPLANACSVRTNNIAHEFVHTLGVGKNSDEYPKSSPYVRDCQSILNSGEKLRQRHLRVILECLQEMMPDSQFSLA